MGVRAVERARRSRFCGGSVTVKLSSLRLSRVCPEENFTPLLQLTGISINQ